MHRRESAISTDSLFSRANLRGVGADSANIDDGILSAYEVQGMNLQGTEIVVLSVCETGLGTLKQGEGVFGLRRAFQLAGSKTVVSALWSVPDEMQCSSECMPTTVGPYLRESGKRSFIKLKS